MGVTCSYCSNYVRRGCVRSVSPHRTVCTCLNVNREGQKALRVAYWLLLCVWVLVLIYPFFLHLYLSFLEHLLTSLTHGRRADEEGYNKLCRIRETRRLEHKDVQELLPNFEPRWNLESPLFEASFTLN